MQFRKPRSAIRISVGLLRNGRRETAYIVDVSEAGMKLQGVLSPTPGESLRLHVRGCVIDGQVRWVKDQLCGIEFCKDASLTELRRFLSALPRLTHALRAQRPAYREYGTQPP